MIKLGQHCIYTKMIKIQEIDFERKLITLSHLRVNRFIEMPFEFIQTYSGDLEYLLKDRFRTLEEQKRNALKGF